VTRENHGGASLLSCQDGEIQGLLLICDEGIAQTNRKMVQVERMRKWDYERSERTN